VRHQPALLFEHYLQAFLQRYAERQATAVAPFLVGREVVDLGAGEGYVAAALHVYSRWLGSWWERLVHHPLLFVLEKGIVPASPIVNPECPFLPGEGGMQLPMQELRGGVSLNSPPNTV
jgi:hypothetical protein